MTFYSDEEYARLLVAAEVFDRRVHLAILFGAEAGLRLGEIVSLRWTDVDFKRGKGSYRAQHVEGRGGYPEGRQGVGGAPQRDPCRGVAARTMRHIHLDDAALEGAIRLLDSAPAPSGS